MSVDIDPVNISGVSDMHRNVSTQCIYKFILNTFFSVIDIL